VRKHVISLGIGIAAAAVALIVSALPLGRSLNNRLYDFLLRRTATPDAAPRDIAIVEINETSLRRLEPLIGRWPWPRLVHASVVDFLARAPAAVVAYDVLFPDRDTRSGFDVGGTSWSGAESDQALGSSIKTAGNVVMLADVTYGGVGPREQAAGPTPGSVERRPAPVLPIDVIGRGARGLGHNLMPLEEDGPVRWTAPLVATPSGLMPSLSVAAFAAAEGFILTNASFDASGVALGSRHIPLETVELPHFANELSATARRVRVRYRGPAQRADGRPLYRTFSFYDLFYSEEQILAGERPLIDPAVFRNAMVIVGTTASGLHDTFATPMGSTGKMAGPQVHAAIVDQLRSGAFIRAVPFGVVAAATLVSSILAALIIGWLALRWSLAGTALLAGAVVAAAFVLFRNGWWLALVEPLGGIGLASFTALAYQYFVEGREKRKVRALFARYVSRDVFEQVLANPALAELGGKRREMTVLFSDLRGFTSLSESGEPEAIVAQLNEYFSRMVEVVFRHRGTLDKFVGDMVMALFGAPVDDEEHADHAVAAAIDMVRELDALNEKWVGEGRPTLTIGIGISSGEMIAGNIGAQTVRSYTVIGDTVNLGSRLEALNKERGTTIIASAETVRRLTQPFGRRSLGVVTVRGRTAPVEIFEVSAVEAGGQPADVQRRSTG
jgi:adenylate cyclase